MTNKGPLQHLLSKFDPERPRISRKKQDIRFDKLIFHSEYIMRQEGIGIVYEFTLERISGWVIPTDDTEKVVIKVNDKLIATALPASRIRLSGEWRNFGFGRSLGDLWNYLGTGDRVTLEYGGRPLPITQFGLSYVHSPKRERKSSVPELLQKMNEGYVFDKNGKFKLSIRHNNEFKTLIHELFQEVAAEIRGRFGYKLFPTYGTLLGAVREGDFIGHDNDWDATYISRHSEPEKVRQEFYKISSFLIRKGYNLRFLKTHTTVRVPKKEYSFDIFFSYFDEAGFYQIGYGTHGPALPRSDDFGIFVDQKLSDLTIRVPRNYLVMLSQIFGENWRTPDPGFKHKSTTRKRDARYFLTIPEISSLYWKQFYRDNLIVGGSSFAAFVAEQLRPRSLIMELGCGSGRDAVYFAQCGHAVYASDRAKKALQQGRNNSGDLPNITFVKVDAAEKSQVHNFFTNALKAQGNVSGDTMLYMRFFLHSVTKDVQDVILDVARVALSSGTLLALEFRTEKDAAETHVHGDHFRRFIPMVEMLQEIEKRGFTIRHSEESRGLSPYEGEDPFLCRIIARKN